MKLARDEKLHLAAGCAVLLWSAITILAFAYGGIGPAAVWATTSMGIGYERLQRFRKEGVPSWRDAAFTAAPGWAVFGVWLVV